MFGVGALGMIGQPARRSTGSLLLYPGYVQHYLDRMTANDVLGGNTQGLERGVTDAFNVVLQDLVADTILGVSGGVIAQEASLSKAMPFMCGARTITGCLTPVVGPAPTSFNFVGANYNRKTGLLGDGAATYLSSNRSNDADPRDNNHNAVYVSSVPTTGISLMGTGSNTAGANNILVASTRSRNAVAQNYPTSLTSGFAGHARTSSTSYTNRANGVSTTYTQTSESPLAGNLYLFARNTGGASTTPILFSNPRISFYGIGEFLNLAILDARITALMNALAGLSI